MMGCQRGGGIRESHYDDRALHGFAEECRSGTGLGHVIDCTHTPKQSAIINCQARSMQGSVPPFQSEEHPKMPRKLGGTMFGNETKEKGSSISLA